MNDIPPLERGPDGRVDVSVPGPARVKESGVDLFDILSKDLALINDGQATAVERIADYVRQLDEDDALVWLYCTIEHVSEHATGAVLPAPLTPAHAPPA